MNWKIRESRRRILAVLLVFSLFFLCLPLLTGCGPKTDRNRLLSYQSFDFFDTVCTLYMVPPEDGSPSFSEAETLFREELERFHPLCDRFHEYEGVTNVAVLNKMAGSETPVAVEGDLFDLLVYGKEAAEKTNGATNILLGAVTDLWKSTAEAVAAAKDRADASLLPSKDALTAALGHTDPATLVLADGRVSLTDPKAKIDLGAVAKGYVCDRITELLQKNGFRDFIVNLGGTVRTDGKKPNGDLFRVGFDESVSTHAVDYLELTDASTATSSAAFRSFTLDGVQYGHLIDPVTASPARLFSSVSVVADSAALCDVLSTALYVLSEQDGRALLASLTDPVSVLWCYPNGKTASFGEAFA